MRVSKSRQLMCKTEYRIGIGEGNVEFRLVALLALLIPTSADAARETDPRLFAIRNC